MDEEMKRELEGIKKELSDLRAVDQRVIASLVRLEAKTGEIVERMMTRDHFSAIMGRMDGFAALLEDSRYRWSVHADMLLEHDRRLKKLESRRA